MQLMGSGELTVVIPMLNEQGAAEGVVSELFQAFESGAYAVKVVCVNDGSTDRTQAVLDELESRNAGLVCLRHDRRQGYGAAIRTGLSAATTDLVGWMDGDGQYDPRDFHELLSRIDAGASGAIGVRTKRADPGHRRALGKVGSFVASRICGLDLVDADAGLKLFDRRTVDLSDLRSNGSYISTEVLRRASGNGYVAQVPIHHRERMSGLQTGASLRVLAHLAVDYLRCVKNST